MKHIKSSGGQVMLFAALWATAALCFAQTAVSPARSASQEQPAPPVPTIAPVQASRTDQVIQRIRIEDAGSRIDEVRVGGQTQSITVQPKTGLNVPAYEIKPSDTANGAAPSTSKGDTTGSRVWNVLRF